MKEHSLFLELGFTPRDSRMAEEADAFRVAFERLLTDATDLAYGNASAQAIQSQQFVTPYTIPAENLTNFYTGVPTNTHLTREESMLAANDSSAPDPGGARSRGCAQPQGIPNDSSFGGV